MMKGKMAPTKSPAKMIGFVRDMSCSEFFPSRLAFLRKPPNKVKPTRAEHPMLIARLTLAAVCPDSSSKFMVSFYSYPKLATLTEVEALIARGDKLWRAICIGKVAIIPKIVTAMP